MKTDEEKGTYDTSDAMEMLGKGYDQPAAIIAPPRTVKALQDGGLVDYQAWGWVKTSAKFRAHIKILRGAKHDIWHYLALGVGEDGQCKETIKQICEGTGYSHTEVINTIRELDKMGYLSVQKGSKGNIYTPEFVARGEKKPTENAVKKVDSTPVDSLDSTPSEEESPAIPLRVKRVKYGADAPDTSELPVDWQVGLGTALTTMTEDELFKKQARDAANLIEQGCAGGGALAYAFMVTRKIILSDSKAKGQRKAAREMLEMKVKPEHVVKATKQLMESMDKRGNPLTVVDLFSVQDTAIAIANQPEKKITPPQSSGFPKFDENGRAVLA